MDPMTEKLNAFFSSLPRKKKAKEYYERQMKGSNFAYLDPSSVDERKLEIVHHVLEQYYSGRFQLHKKTIAKNWKKLCKEIQME